MCDCLWPTYDTTCPRRKGGSPRLVSSQATGSRVVVVYAPDVSILNDPVSAIKVLDLAASVGSDGSLLERWS